MVNRTFVLLALIASGVARPVAAGPALVWAVGDNGTIVHTNNGGKNWVAQRSMTSALLQGVAFADANDGWAVGNVGTILHTSNGGKTWAAQTSTIPNTLIGVATAAAVAPVPEPSSLLQAGLGVACVLGYAWRRGWTRAA